MEKRDYEGALYYLMTETAQLNGGKIVPLSQSAIDDLQELVKRNEPIKLKTKRVKVSIDDYRIDDYCPTCDEELYTTSNYCPHCGQKLDWSDEK
jgi:rRNA maturation protein Nop10